jgi:hypothetical protein
VFVRSIVRKGYKLQIGRIGLSQFAKSGDVHRFVIALGLILLYYVFLGRLPFVILSAAYLFITVMVFKGAKWWVNAIVSVLTSVIVWLVFEVVFLVPLP